MMKLKAFLYALSLILSIWLFIYILACNSSLKAKEEKNKTSFYEANEKKIDDILLRIRRQDAEHEYKMSTLRAEQKYEIALSEGIIGPDERRALIDRHVKESMDLFDTHMSESNLIIDELPVYEEDEGTIKTLKHNKNFLILVSLVIVFSAIKFYIILRKLKNS